MSSANSYLNGSIERKEQRRLRRKQQRTINLWMWGIIFIVLAAELIGAYIIVYQNGFVMQDAVSRTANAYYVLNLFPRKLASIGFVWNPLPSLLQLPVLTLAKYWKPLASSGFAGCIVTSVFAAVNAGAIFRYLKLSGISTLSSILITFLYAFHPFIFYYGLNGLSETMFFTAMIFITTNMSFWVENRKTGHIIVSALMLAMAMLTRYETFALVVGCAVVLFVVIYFMEDQQSPFKNKPVKMKIDYMTATGTVLFLPVVYTLLVWMFLNWTIMGDPFYFLRSVYSNEAQTAWVYEGFRQMVSNPVSALVYSLVEMLPFLPVCLVILIERRMSKRIFRLDLLILVLLVGSIAGMHWLMLWQGKSFGWLRFFSFALPFSVAWLPYELQQLSGKLKQITIGLVCGALVLSGALTIHYFHDVNLAKEEYALFFHEEEITMGIVSSQIEMAEIINHNYSDNIILLDSFTMSSLILHLDDTKKLIATASDDFDDIIKDPAYYGVEYIVVPNPNGVDGLDAITREFPKLYDGGEEWAELAGTAGQYKIFRVKEEYASVYIPLSDSEGDLPQPLSGSEVIQ